MDAEKHAANIEHQRRPAEPTAVKYVRAFQHVFATITVAFVACAIDRNIVMPGVTAEEKALCASSIFTMLVLLYHIVAPYKKTVALGLDSATTAFLFATFIFGAIQAGTNGGACRGPKKIGVWDNHRGCSRMTISTGFSAVGFAAFAVSTALHFMKK